MPFDSPSTVSSLRPICQNWSDPSPSAKGIFTPVAAPNFLIWLNEVCSRINNDGLWKGVQGEVVYKSVPLGFITLPRRYQTVMGACYGNYPVNMFTQYNQFKDMGLGYRNPKQYGQMGFTDMGDGWCVQQDLDDTTPSYLTIKITNPSDAGKVIRFYGQNNTLNPSEVYDLSGDSGTGSDGIAVTTVYPTVTTSVQFTSLERIIAGTTSAYFNYPWYLSSVIQGTPTQVGSYEPGEMNPQYRRWKTGVINFNSVTQTSTEPTCQAIRLLCKRRITPLIYETDVVFPGAPYAISVAMQSLRYEKIDGDLKKAIAYWADAVKILNDEIKSSTGRTQRSIPFRLGYPALPEQTF